MLVVVSVSETQVAVHAGMLARKAAGEIEADARAALDQVAAEGVELRLVHGRADDAMLAASEGRNARRRRVARETTRPGNASGQRGHAARA